MFQASIYIRCPDEYAQQISSVLNETRPKEITASFADMPETTLSFKPQIVTNQPPQNLNNPDTAPNLVLFFFTCNDKTDYSKVEKPNYTNFVKVNKREYVPILPVFINDINKTGKAKAKGFFNQTNSIIAVVQADYPTAQIIEYKSSGVPKKTSFAHMWPSLINLVVMSVNNRLNLLKSMLTKSPLTFDTFRTSVKICLVYDSICCFTKVLDSADNIEKNIARNASMFNFINPKSLAYRFDFCIGADQAQANIFSDNPTEYDLRFILLKRRIQAYLCTENICGAIDSTFNFILSVSDRIRKEKDVTEYMYNMWLTQALFDLQNQCTKETEMNKNIVIPHYASILEWYIRMLPIMHREILKRSKSEAEIAADPLSSNNNDAAAKDKEISLLEKMLSRKERYNSEMQRSLTSLINLYVGSGFSRNAAIIMEKLCKYSPEENKQFKTASTMTIAKKGYPHLFPQITEDMLNSIPFDERIYSCCRVIADKFAKNREVACKVISDTFSVISPNKKFRISINLPINLTISNEENLTYVEGDPASVKIKFRCGFPGELKTKRLLVGFMNWQYTKIVYLETHDATVSEGAELSVANTFIKPGSYVIYNVKLVAGECVMNVILPPSNQLVHVDPRPLPVDFEIEMPNFLLPRRWQLALIRLTISRPVESLELKVNGLSFHPTPLRLKNKEVREPTNGLMFSNVLEGVHDYFLSIQPHVSGTLKIEAIANNQTVAREVNYTVSEFLELKLIYRKLTKVAQLSAFVKSQIDLTITGVDFMAQDNENIKCEVIGLPTVVGMSQTTALFILDAPPEVANVWVKQKGLKEFSLRLNVEKADEKALTLSQNNSGVRIPLTTLSPIDFSL